MDSKVKNILIGVLFILFMISLAVIYYLVKGSSNELLTIKGNVIVASDDYVIIEGINEDYVINNIKGQYNVGDEVEFKYNKKDLNSKVSPKTIKVSDEELIKVRENDLDEDSNIEENSSSGNYSSNSGNSVDKTNNGGTTTNNNGNNSANEKDAVNNQSSSGTNSGNLINSEKESNGNSPNSNATGDADSLVLSYFEDYQADINSENLGSSVKSGFVSIVDFLFYNGTIKGHTFGELTDSAKLKVLAMALYFDGKIEKYFPGYKESISSATNKVYTNIKEEIVTTYLNVASKVCTSNSDACEKAKNGFAELKKNFSLTWDLIKDIAGDGLTNLKNWYEIWRTT